MEKMLAVISLMTFFCLGCTSSLPPSQYLSYVESPGNGLHIKKESGDIQYELQYKPLDYMLYKENIKQAYSPSDLKERKQELEGYYYFTLRMSSKSNKPLLETKENSQQNFDRLSYAEFNAQKDFTLVAGKDTIPCEIYQFERNYNLAPFNNFVLAFPVKQPGQINKLTVLYRDNLFGFGTIDFGIESSTINKIPVIKSL